MRLARWPPPPPPAASLLLLASVDRGRRAPPPLTRFLAHLRARTARVPSLRYHVHYINFMNVRFQGTYKRCCFSVLMSLLSTQITYV